MIVRTHGFLSLSHSFARSRSVKIYRSALMLLFKVLVGTSGILDGACFCHLFAKAVQKLMFHHALNFKLPIPMNIGSKA